MFISYLAKGVRRLIRNMSDESICMILYVEYELYSLGLLNASGESLLGFGDINHSKMKLQGTTVNLQ